MLNYASRGDTATRPGTWAVGRWNGSPKTGSASGIVASFAAAVRLGATFFQRGRGTYKNATAMTFGTFGSVVTINVLQVWDNSATDGGAGDMLFFGLLSAARTLSVGDQIVISAGTLAQPIAGQARATCNLDGPIRDGTTPPRRRPRSRCAKSSIT